MTNRSHSSRRHFLKRSGSTGVALAAAGVGPLGDWLRAGESSSDGSALVRKIADAEIRAGVEAAIARNLIPAATEQAYPGYFNITADGGAYGGEATW